MQHMMTPTYQALDWNFVVRDTHAFMVRVTVGVAKNVYLYVNNIGFNPQTQHFEYDYGIVHSDDLMKVVHANGDPWYESSKTEDVTKFARVIKRILIEHLKLVEYENSTEQPRQIVCV